LPSVTPAYRRGNRSTPTVWSAPLRLLVFVLAPLLALTTIGTLVILPTAVAAAAGVPEPTAAISLQTTGGGEADTKDFILAGEDATFDVRVTNASTDTDGYNTSFAVLVPNGIAFVASGGMGSPTVYPSGAALPNSAVTSPTPYSTVPAGYQLWVFLDVADLPAMATYSSTLTVRPDATVFPVGTAPELTLGAYVSADATVLPVFDGSTGKGGTAGQAETSTSSASDTAPVQALRLTKSEPSPESELLRGVHDNPTTYTLTVEATPQGTTDGVTIVDYLPAGLEFLGCATVDNTQDSPLLYDAAGQPGGSEEYPGSGPVATGGAGTDCLVPAAVETVNSGLPAGLPTGVYTKVTWQLPSLSGGTAQATDLSAAGTASSYVITYRAAVPLFENTMDFVTTAGDVTPPTTGEQAANLNNNHGASTRQGQGTGYDDGIAYTNVATVTGTYTGTAPASGPVAASDSDSEVIDAMDLRVLKSVNTHAGSGASDTFVTGGLATFTLQLDTGEYTTAGGMTLVDTIPNGLCPALPADAYAGVDTSGFPSDCRPAFTGGSVAPVLSGATVDGIAYDPATGEFTLTLTVAPDAIAAEDEALVQYTALMRAQYQDTPSLKGNITSGDTLTNHVAIDGDTHSIDELDGVTNGDGVEAFGDEDVTDDSSADIESNYSSVDKQVLARNSVIASASPTAAVSCDVPDGSSWSDDQGGDDAEPFVAGDYVCYSLTVDFAQQIDVRNPKITDFLPEGVEYVDSAVASGTGIDVAAPTVSGQRVEWLVGATGADGNRYAPQSGKLVLHVLGRITAVSASETTPDKPQNLMKYQQENALGEVFFLRDAANIRLDAGPSLVKGIRDVDGEPAAGNAFDSGVTGLQVQDGSLVTYRIDITAPEEATSGYTVWDALPAGIKAADVQAGSTTAATVAIGGSATETATTGFTAVAVDPGDAGYPTGDVAAAYAGRSLMLWTVAATVPGDDAVAGTTGGLTLGYTVWIPVDAQIDTAYTNTAPIVCYQTNTNTGGHGTVVVEDGPISTVDPATGDSTIPAASTYDDAEVHLPAASVAKDLLGTEVTPSSTPADGNNTAAQATQGEYIDFGYGVTIPAHTTVVNGVLQDSGLTPATAFTVDSACWRIDSGTCATAAGGGFVLDAATGKLTFPSSYSNTTDAAQTFTVELRIHLGDAGNTNRLLTNTARFTSASWNGSDTATVTYVEPTPTLDKSASPSTNLVGGQTVTYTLKATLPSGNPKLYDDVVTDCVPAALENVQLVGTNPGVTIGAQGTSCVIGSGSTPNGTSISWHFDELAAGAPQQIQYTVTLPLEPSGSNSYTNTATLTGYTLPSTLDPTNARRGSRTSTDSQTLTVAPARIVKSVDKASAPIGDTVAYSLQVTLPANVQFYDTAITDTLPTGVAFGAVTGWTTTGAGAPAQVTPTQSGQTLTWSLGDIAAASVERTVTITFTAKLTDAVASGTPNNTSALTWNRVDDDATTKQTQTSDKSVTILNPNVAIAKTVDNAASIVANPGQTFTYRVKLTNNGNTPAYNLTVTDVVPAGVRVDPTSISNGGTLSGQDATTGGGGTITWDAAHLPGPLNTGAAAAQTLSYTATLIASGSLTDVNQVNTASLTHYESFPTDGRSYPTTAPTSKATVDPAFPHLTLTKTASGTDPAGANIAYADTPFPWTLTLVNSGQGPAQTISAEDVLPKNWSYDAGSAKISIGGAAAVALADPTVGTSGGVQTLSWSTSQLSATAPALPGTASGATAAQRTIVITFTATPSQAALVDPGVDVNQVNTLRAVTTDTSGATSNASGSYTGPDATAAALLQLADLVLDKAAVGGTTSGQWIPGQAVGTGYTQPQWQLTLTNAGPDKAYGPFRYVDTATLPAGVTVGAYTARYYSSVADTTGTALTITGTGTASDPYVVGTTATSLKADGSDRIVLTANVTIAAAATGTASNTADASGRTYESELDNNTDTADKPLTPQADLAMDKTGPATPPNAGDPLSWTLTVTNNGASDSVSTTASPITVTDTIPAGMAGVTLGTLPSGWSASGTSFEAGDTVTFTLADGQRLTPSQSVQFVLNGTVPASQPAGTAITNTATVHPGATPDPDPDNNTDDATTTPTTNTTLGVDKTRVVLDGGSWVSAVSLTPVPPVTPGDPVTYLVTVTNTGAADARNVTITDQVPSYLAYASFEGVSGTWTRTSTTAAAGDDQTFALTGSLAPGASASFRVTLGIDAGWNDTVTNTAVATADNSTNTPTDTDSSDSTRDADLSIAKAHTSPVAPASVNAGESVDYRLTVTNHGPSDSSGPIVITDTLPLGFDYRTGSARVAIAGGTATALAPTLGDDGGRQTLTWTIGDGSTSLPDGATIVVTYTADIDPTVTAGSYVNDAVVDGPDDNDPSNDTTSDTVPVTESADLSIVKTAAAGPYVAGQTVSYTVTVTNAGPSVARNVSVVDAAPAGTTLTAMSGTGWSCDLATATCAMPLLAVGSASFTVTASIAANVPDGTSLTNVVTATSSTPDPTGPVTDDETITVDAVADLSLVKTAVDASGAEITSADAGTQVRYRLQVHNAGPSDAVGPLTIVDTLPAGFSYVGIADGGAAWTGTVDPSDPQQVTFTRTGGLAAGGDAEDLTILVAIDAAQPLGTSVNTATVDSATTDPTPADNTDTAPLEVTQLADLSVVKTHDAAAVRIGDELDFTLAVLNDGPSDATGVVVTDTIPAGLEYVDAAGSDPAWTIVADPVAPDGTTTVRATLTGTLTVGTPAPALVITTLVTVDAYPGVDNVATVTADQPDPDPSNDTSDDTVTVPPQSALVLTKTAVGAFQVGSDASYLITVTNIGTTEDPGPVVIEDDLAAGLVYRSATSADATCAATGSVVRCAVTGPIAVGATVQITLLVHVGQAAYPTVSNTAVVTTPTEQLPTAVPSDTVTTPVAADPLAGTGVDRDTLMLWLGLALALLLLGAMAVVMVRRRRQI